MKAAYISTIFLLTSSVVPSFAVERNFNGLSCKSTGAVYARDTIYDCSTAIERYSTSFGFNREWKWYDFSAEFNDAYNPNKVSIYLYETASKRTLLGIFDAALTQGYVLQGHLLDVTGQMTITVNVNGTNFTMEFTGWYKSPEYGPSSDGYKTCVSPFGPPYDSSCYWER